MARIFTTKFRFNHRLYDAIVTVVSHDGQMNFNVRVMDMELFGLIPGGNLRYEGREGFKDLQAQNDISGSLMNSIANAIEEHLVEKP